MLTGYHGLIVTDIKQVDAGEGGRDVRVWTLACIVLSLFYVLTCHVIHVSCHVSRILCDVALLSH